MCVCQFLSFHHVEQDPLVHAPNMYHYFTSTAHATPCTHHNPQLDNTPKHPPHARLTEKKKSTSATVGPARLNQNYRFFIRARVVGITVTQTSSMTGVTSEPIAWISFVVRVFSDLGVCRGDVLCADRERAWFLWWPGWTGPESSYTRGVRRHRWG